MSDFLAGFITGDITATFTDMYRQMRPQWTHVGHLCSIASRAREKPVSVRGATQLWPLRDQNNLWGWTGGALLVVGHFGQVGKTTQ